jgi:glycosyltransferase involved in cell wall biosynthesis
LKLARFVRQHEIEIIHAHVARDYPLAALAARRACARLVLTRHVLFPLHRIHRLTLRRTARVIGVSQAVVEGLRAQGIFEAERIVLIHNGIDVDRFAQGRDDLVRREPSTNRKLRVGTIGHLAPIKGHEDFIRAAAAVCARRDDVEFIIAGEDKSRSGEHRRSIEKLIDELNLKQHVRLIGWVEDVAKLLSTLDLFVSPSRSEPFGLSIVEAMAARVPVVSTMSEGAKEIIDDNRTGRLTPIADVEALAKAIDGLIVSALKLFPSWVERSASRSRTLFAGADVVCNWAGLSGSPRSEKRRLDVGRKQLDLESVFGQSHHSLVLKAHLLEQTN